MRMKCGVRIVLLCCIVGQHVSGQAIDKSSPTIELRLVDRAVTGTRTGEVPINGVARITNPGDPKVFSWLDTWTLIVADREDKILQDKGYREIARQWTREDVPLVERAGSTSMLVNGRLKWLDGGYHFVFKDTYGGLQIFGPLEGGQYSIAIEYIQEPEIFAGLAAAFVFERLRIGKETLWRGKMRTGWQKVDVFIP
jgi:hypothetical protein